MASLKKYQGSCHCGTVQFEVDLPGDFEAQTCTCSICEMTGFVHIIVPQSKFRLIQGADNLTEYKFNTGVAKHLFCKTCGVKAFYRPRSNPDGWSVNARCLSGYPNLPMKMIAPFDGKDWENQPSIAHKSQE
jgi:hypothetical protein